MELGIIGLGRMGSNMARRLLKAGHQVIVYDSIKEAIDALVEEGAFGAISLSELVQKLTVPRAVWLMVPSGEPTENVINALATVLYKGDIIIDGGNSNYRDSMRRSSDLSHIRYFSP